MRSEQTVKIMQLVTDLWRSIMDDDEPDITECIAKNIESNIEALVQELEKTKAELETAKNDIDDERAHFLDNI